MFNHFSVLIFLCLFAAACSTEPTESSFEEGRIRNFTECRLTDDQGSGSFQGKWSTLPIPVVLDREFYATDDSRQADQIKTAIRVWDSWGKLRGYDKVFEIQNDVSGPTAGANIPATDDCDQGNITSSFTGAVGIWKIKLGGDGKNTRDNCDGGTAKILPDGVQGQTDWDVSGGVISNASILLNFEGFNAPGKVRIDLHSLALHELGHVLGLLHSCNPTTDGSDITSAVSCNTAGLRLLEAVMFPFLTSGQIRRELKQNDYDRINCIY